MGVGRGGNDDRVDSSAGGELQLARCQQVLAGAGREGGDWSLQGWDVPRC
jgi:hypothetical protein